MQDPSGRARARAEGGALFFGVAGSRTSLGDPLERGLTSVPGNMLEVAYGRGTNRQARYHSAAASAREAFASLETAEALGWVLPVQPELSALFNPVVGSRWIE